MQVQAAGMPWFQEDDYASFRRLLPNRRWHPTYQEWLHAAEQNLKRLEAMGVVTVKAYVRSDQFADWCRATGREVDTEALVAWGNEAAIREYSKLQGH